MQYGIPGASQWLVYMQDAAQGLELRCMSVEGELKHFEGGRDKTELDGGVTAVQKYGHKALTCRKLDYVTAESDSLCFLDSTTLRNVSSAE